MRTKSETKLSIRQQRFVEAYTGNGVEACRAAGYKGDDNSLAAHASRLLRSVKIREVLQSREQERQNPLIADRIKRQLFWSAMMMDEQAEMRDRLRASELLGRSEGDFLERVQTAGNINVNVIDSLSVRLQNARRRVQDRAEE